VTNAVAEAVARLTPNAASRGEDRFAPERIGVLLEQAGFQPKSLGQLEASMELADLESALRAMLSALGEGT
jgi:predicted dinucleotide-binding enzyme